MQKIDKQKATQRKNRVKIVRLALVGYTNVGKSTIMNLLAKTDVFAENKLFATLDTTVRKIVIDNLPFLLSDTVGFIRKLPHALIESFKSTLDEVRESDILIHVVDISHSNFYEQMETVNQTLEEIGAADKTTILLFNKIDAYPEEEKTDDIEEENIPKLIDFKRMWLDNSQNPTVFISAKEKTNVEEMKQIGHHRKMYH